MKSGLVTSAGSAARTSGAPREGLSSSGVESGGAPFAEVMNAQDRQASRERTPSAGPAAGGSRGGVEPSGPRAPGAGATAARPTAGAGADAPGVDEVGVDTLLGVGDGVSAEFGTEAGLDAIEMLPAETGAAPSPIALPQFHGSEPAQREPAQALRTLLATTEGFDELARAAARDVDMAQGAASLLETAGATGFDGAGAVGTGGTDPLTGMAFAGTRAVSRLPGMDAAGVPNRPPELRAPIGTPAWTDELGSRVTWMLERGEQVASLRLSPENLGPLEVRIAVREGETTVWFGAAQADTRAALEQSLPRLKEMLGASGLALANAGVFSETPRDPQRGFTAAALARASMESGADQQGAVVTSVTRRGLVDLYA